MVWDPAAEDLREELEPLYYDVPKHLRTELWLWIEGKIRPPQSQHSRLSHAHPVERFLTAMRLESASLGNYSQMFQAIEQGCKGRPDFQLKAIRTCLRTFPNDAAADVLEAILVRGHSGYTVSADKRNLEFRVPPPAREQIEEATKVVRENVAELLTRAWNAAYGLEPRYDDAWTAAFGAVEAALRPIISPNDGDARLGKMIDAYEAKPSKWKSLFEESRPTYDPKKHTALDGRETVMQMARTICYGQKRRHAGGDQDANGRDEARGVVHLAISLAMLCHEGTFCSAEQPLKASPLPG